MTQTSGFIKQKTLVWKHVSSCGHLIAVCMRELSLKIHKLLYIYYRRLSDDRIQPAGYAGIICVIETPVMRGLGSDVIRSTDVCVPASNVALSRRRF